MADDDPLSQQDDSLAMPPSIAFGGAAPPLVPAMPQPRPSIAYGGAAYPPPPPPPTPERQIQQAFGAAQARPLQPAAQFGPPQPTPEQVRQQQDEQRQEEDKQRRADEERQRKQHAEGLMKSLEEEQKRLDPLLAEQERRLAQPLPELPRQERVRQPPPQDLGKNANSWLMASSVLAGFAGLASRRSSINALSAFSGALDGFAAGDKQRFDANYQTWKAEADTTIQNNQIEMDAYQAALKRRDLDQTQIANIIQIEATRFRNEWVRQVAAEAARTGDTDTLYAALDGAQGKLAELAIAKERIQANVEAMIEKTRLQQSGAFRPRETDEGIQFRAQRLVAGDVTGAYRGISVTSPDRPAIDQAAYEVLRSQNPGASEADFGRMLAQAAQDYAGGVSQARITGGIGARVEFATGELARFAKTALEASDNLPRGRYRTFNQFAQAAAVEFSDPNFASFQEYHQSLINAYARAMQPLGVGSVFAMQQAKELLETATSGEAYRAKIVAMFNNVNNERAAIAEQQHRPAPPRIEVPPPPKAPTGWERIRQGMTPPNWMPHATGNTFFDLGGGWGASLLDLGAAGGAGVGHAVGGAAGHILPIPE